ncbi:DUF58 domain-containing protein [Thiofilum flexile]|uniref:DUF58 domain-containing protein n=1 Tax=Thiofilum flexile TaxID=125627 RepID=UPI00035E3C56|nr:DUF58 domain-containing protein [Thiofilum flexile]
MQAGEGIVYSSLNALIRLKAQVAALQRAKKHAEANTSGGYRTVFKGRGMDFAESRPYQAGDDIRTIDWRVTARSGKVHTKVFQEERERPVMLWLDMRPAMYFATRNCFKSVLASEVAALLVWKTLEAGDRIGGFIQTTHHCAEFKPSHAYGAALHLLRHIADTTQLQQPNTQAALSLLDESWGRLRRVATAGAQVILISDFKQTTPAALRQLALISQHCEVSLIHIQDPFEAKMPDHLNGKLRLTDGQYSLWISLQQRFRECYAERSSLQLNQLKQYARRYRMGFLTISTDMNTTERLRLLARSIA